ncbi:hypothetical protein [Rickettsia endosymbiont of Halotydeus destructor]|uniref:hypothetical protein n=1 Tax=Rickettsia endosymbiont of Halotydeus destructor TaxID=2996754 RepID=UPI003BB0AA17
MKITYEFFKSLQSLLNKPNWQEPLITRLEQIVLELTLVQNRNNEKAQGFLKKIAATKNEKAKDTITKQYNDFIQIGAPKSEQNLKNEQIQLQKCLENNSYKIGIAPLDTIEHAKFLLANIHVLDLPEVNKDTAEAFKNTLRENFHKLADEEVFRAATSRKSKFDDCNDNVLKKIINNQKVELKDFEDEIEPIDENEEENNAFIQITQHLIKQLNILDNEVVKEVVTTINFISNFYESNFVSNTFAFNLAQYFNNPEDLHNFLTTIDFSTPQSAEAGILLIPIESIHLSELTKEERDLWHTINGKYGKEGIKLFAKALDIKNAGIQIIELYNENNSDLNQTFKALKETAKNIKFAQEDSYPELAKLCHKYNYSEDIFTRIIDKILPNVKQQDDHLPDIKFNIQAKGETYTFSKLPAGDLRGLFLGKMTQCCQFIGGDSEKCVIDGFTKDTAGFYILTDSKGKIMAQSYAWLGVNEEGREVLMLDSFEHLPEGKKLFLPFLSKLTEAIQNDNLMEIYLGSGGKTPRLSASTENIITPKDGSLFQYSDSKSAYKIAGKLELGTLDNFEKIPTYNNFDEFFEFNRTKAANNLQNQYSDLFEGLNYANLGNINLYAAALNKLLSQNKLIAKEMNSFIKSLESFGGTKIINILCNNELVNFETRLDVISQIFKKYPGNNDKIQYMLYAFQNINKSLIEEIGLDKLLEAGEKCTNLIFLLTNPTNSLSFKKQFEIITKIPDEFQNDYNKLSTILFKCSNIGEEILNQLDIEKVINFCSQETSLPLSWYKTGILSSNQQLDNIKASLLKYNSNILDNPDETNILGKIFSEDEGGY